MVFPLTSVTYIWTMIISKIWLNERITSRKLLGVTLILIGCVLLSYNKLN
ncbi:MAG: EamA family transporter [Bacillus sp. (in: firmicutes)]